MAKNIIYLTALEDGVKKGSGGFLKLDRRTDGVTYTLQVNSGYVTDTLVCPVKDAEGGKIGELRLERGKGRLEASHALETAPGWVYDGYLEIRISGSRKVTGRWEAEKKPARLAAEKKAAGPLPQESPTDVTDVAGRGEERASEPYIPEKRASERDTSEERAAALQAPEKRVVEPQAPEERLAEPQAPKERLAEPQTREKRAAEPYDSKEKALELHTAERLPEQEEEPETDSGKNANAGKGTDAGKETVDAAERYYADKWEQLCHMFPGIHPFGDEREYLSIAPKDFIIFRQQYQKLVHNSFLLHGYYNYRHLILGKFYQNRKILYYLGTPGVYYEKEKMAAEMFGFEAFEYAGDRIENGIFGYYMRRVEL